MNRQPSMAELRKIKAKGVKYRGPYHGRWFHVGVAFECDDVAAIMRLGAAIAKSKTLAPLLKGEIHSDNSGDKILVSFHALHVYPDGPKAESERLQNMLAEALQAQNAWQEENKGRF